jgi:nicotinate-nucleotide adenylyltransferase
MKIGVFGGTFDPPHIGHLILADEAYSQLDLGCVLWVLTSNPPHKKGGEILDIHQRIDLVSAAIHSDPKFELSRVDIERPSPHYAADTMQLLNNAYPEQELVYLMGADSLENLVLWHKPSEFVKFCAQIGVMRRPGIRVELEKVEASFPGIGDKLKFIETPLFDVSASQIRSKIRKKLAYRYYLPAKVYKLIEVRNLYR